MTNLGLPGWWRRLAGAAALLGALLFAVEGPNRQAYVMISGWGLYPALDSPADPASSTLRSTLSDLGKSGVSGIVYGTLGVPPQIRKKAKLPDDFDPNAYNQALFQLAKGNKA